VGVWQKGPVNLGLFDSRIFRLAKNATDSKGMRRSSSPEVTHRFLFVFKGEIKMDWYKDNLIISTEGKKLNEFTDQINRCIREWGIEEGMCFLFIQHTSASLTINENAAPSARRDLETFMEKIVPEGDPWHRHTAEGPDDSPSHMRAMLTLTSLSIPIDRSRLNLGTWQGIYVFEHRERGQRRNVLLRCLSVA